MPTTIAELSSAMDSLAPVRLAEKWDNVGLLVGDPAASVERVLLAIDYTPAVALEARKRQCQAVIAYHPPLFQALKRFVPGGGLFEAARDGIALYSPHTAWDAVVGGANDFLIDTLEPNTKDRVPLRPDALLPEAGAGRIATIAPTDRKTLLYRARAVLGVSVLLVAGPTEGELTRIAVCAGAGAELLDDAISKGAALYLTGELRHHDALRAVRAGVTIACALHSNSERASLARMRDSLLKILPNLECFVSTEDHDPFQAWPVQ